MMTDKRALCPIDNHRNGHIGNRGNRFQLKGNLRFQRPSALTLRNSRLRRARCLSKNPHCRTIRALKWEPPLQSTTSPSAAEPGQHAPNAHANDSLDPLTDAFLLTRAQCGDQAAFTQLVERHHASLIRMCTSYLKDHHGAEDSAQVALERAWIKIGDCRGDFRCWLFAIARNHALDELKKPEHQRTTQFAVQDVESPLARTEELLDEIVAQRIDLYSAIKRLPPPYRAVVELRMTEENFDAIATKLGIRPATARKHFQRAIQALRNLLILGADNESAFRDAA